MEYIRRGRFTEQELDAIASGVKIGIGKPETTKLDEGSLPGLGKGYRNSEPNESAAREKRKTRGRVAAALSKLESMGVIVYGADTLTEEDGEVKPLNPQSGTWGHLAGYEEQKQEIEDTILLALQQPEIYDRIARGTRREFESNRPRAILFDGPPGGNTLQCDREKFTYEGLLWPLTFFCGPAKVPILCLNYRHHSQLTPSF